MLLSAFLSDSQQLNNLLFKQTARYIRTDNLAEVLSRCSKSVSFRTRSFI